MKVRLNVDTAQGAFQATGTDWGALLAVKEFFAGFTLGADNDPYILELDGQRFTGRYGDIDSIDIEVLV